MTGLLILMPAVITFMLVRFFIELFTQPFLGWVKFFWSGAPETQLLASELIVLVALISVTFIVGFLGLQPLLSAAKRILYKIPLVSPIFRAVEELLDAFFDSDTPSFSKAVLIPFPGPNSYAIGFVTKQALESSLTPVFVVSTPNPTWGLIVNVSPEEILPLDMEISKAFKFVISCGATYEA
jgi:uncharacterized membrane protein